MAKVEGERDAIKLELERVREEEEVRKGSMRVIGTQTEEDGVMVEVKEAEAKAKADAVAARAEVAAVKAAAEVELAAVKAAMEVEEGGRQQRRRRRQRLWRVCVRSMPRHLHLQSSR